MVIVVFFLDKNQTWCKEKARELYIQYKPLVAKGSIRLVHVYDRSIYPDFSKVKRTYNDSPQRVAWRTKQNIDYAFMFKYCTNISKFYIQLEDDVIAADNYFGEIIGFIGKTKAFWYCIDFSNLGFIGKLLRSSDLEQLAQYVLMFFDEQPGDLLLRSLKIIKTQEKDITPAKSLFQHKGIVSSMSNKRQFIEDGSFGKLSKSMKQFYHYNPTAIIDTNIETYSDHEPVHAYDMTDKYFWGLSPTQGSYYRIIFDTPQNISRIFIDSGHETKPSDILHDAVVRVSVKTDRPTKQSDKISCDNSKILTNFTNGDVNTNNSIPHNIDCIIVEILKNQSDWLVIREIAIFLVGEPAMEVSRNERPNWGKSDSHKWQSWHREPNREPHRESNFGFGKDAWGSFFKQQPKNAKPINRGAYERGQGNGWNKWNQQGQAKNAPWGENRLFKPAVNREKSAAALKKWKL